MYKITTPVVKKKTLIGSVDTETGLDKYRKQIYALENYLFRYLRRYPKIVMTQAEYDLITPINDTVYVIIENGEIKKIYKDMLAIFNSQNSGGSTPTPSDPIQDLVDAYKARLTTPLTAGEEAVYYTAFKGLVDDGLWDKLDGLLVYYAPSEDAALENWVRDAYHGTKVPAGTPPSFTAKQGFTTDGTNGISPLWNFSDVAKKAGQDSWSLFVYETNSAATNTFVAGIYSGVSDRTGIRRSTDGAASRFANNTALITTGIGGTDKQGWIGTTRNSSAACKLFVNDANFESATASNTPPTLFYLVSGGYVTIDGTSVLFGSAGVHRCLVWGAGFSDTDYNNLRTHLNKFFTDLP